MTKIEFLRLSNGDVLENDDEVRYVVTGVYKDCSVAVKFDDEDPGDTVVGIDSQNLESWMVLG